MKRLMSLLTAVLFVFVSSGAYALDQSPVHINPQSLRETLVKRNIGILVAWNQVQQAKTQVNIARAQLLPSVNLGSVISGGPSFLLSSVSALLPFLMPSKWFDLKESSELLDAQGVSYYLAQLNIYAAAYSLYLTILGDIQLRESIYQQYQNLRGIEEEMRRPAEIGMISKEEFLQAQAQAHLAGIQLSQVDELVKREKASIREMLALPLSQEIVFEATNIAPSAAEDKTPEELLEIVHATSPESMQRFREKTCLGMKTAPARAPFVKWLRTPQL